MSFLKIIRPFNCIFAMICVFFGAFYLKNITFLPNAVWAAVSAGLISAAGYVINDFFDIDIDIINRPERILPSGKISPQAAYLYAIILFILGLLASVLTHEKYCILIAFVNTLLLFYYAKYLKKIALVGNITVAYAAGSSFVFGALATQNLRFGLIPAIFASLYTLIRELIKDAEDVDGDKELGAKTLPVIFDESAAIYGSIIPFALMIGLTLMFYLNGIFTLFTLIVMNLFVNIPFTITLVKLRLNPSKINFSKASKFIKLDMIVLLLVLLTVII